MKYWQHISVPEWELLCRIVVPDLIRCSKRRGASGIERQAGQNIVLCLSLVAMSSWLRQILLHGKIWKHFCVCLALQKGCVALPFFSNQLHQALWQTGHIAGNRMEKQGKCLLLASLASCLLSIGLLFDI